MFERPVAYVYVLVSHSRTINQAARTHRRQILILNCGIKQKLRFQMPQPLALHRPISLTKNVSKCLTKLSFYSWLSFVVVVVVLHRISRDWIATDLWDVFFFFRGTLRPTETIRLIRDGRMEVQEEGDYNYTYRYTVTTRMTPALRWAAIRAILMFH